MALKTLPFGFYIRHAPCRQGPYRYMIEIFC